MGRHRPRPVAEASTFRDALAAIAPSPEQLETFETFVTFLLFVCRHPEEIERLSTEKAGLLADNTRLKAENAREKVKGDELKAVVTRTLDQLMDIERAGHPVKLPQSITGAR